MSYIIRTSSAGLIYVLGSKVIKIGKPNSIDGCKTLGKSLLINADQIVFLGFNMEHHVTFFMTNGFEISLQIPFAEAEEAFNCAKGNIEKIIR
ncbi:hypothetical protein MKJ01_02935 [Chryseobacterium sp. SSA4.19]|uniref:hypothetical protein n=1 Tax=Chryseobacterium sp. SSA4.19 TaxID=2919915 RepID=UPI001F4D534F|nr:hypothetical protein [Chryseobacterium sp. SSA4.19]MCJ8152718.1 hypothetical protein [Chryseobacterium sp. SSA4.19]